MKSVRKHPNMLGGALGIPKTADICQTPHLSEGYDLKKVLKP